VTDEVGIVVQSIGRGLTFVKILPVVACGCLFFGSFPNDTELLVGVLNYLL
jgi:hypothetical protein